MTGDCTLLNWNTEWKRPSGRAGALIRKTISRAGADVVCITEGFVDGAPEGYFGVFSEEDYGYPVISGRRKVALWSRTPWTETFDSLDKAPPGRFVSAVTEAAGVGTIRVVGVCVPWEAAHVSTGRRDRRRWEDHVTFLKALLRHLDEDGKCLPTILAGDFNQTWPPRRAPQAAREAFDDLVSRFQFVGKAKPEQRSVCHAFVRGGLVGRPLRDLENYCDGIRLSDHRGHLASFAVKRSRQPEFD